MPTPTLRQCDMATCSPAAAAAGAGHDGPVTGTNLLPCPVEGSIYQRFRAPKIPVTATTDGALSSVPSPTLRVVHACSRPAWAHGMFSESRICVCVCVCVMPRGGDDAEGTAPCLWLHVSVFFVPIMSSCLVSYTCCAMTPAHNGALASSRRVPTTQAPNGLEGNRLQ